MYIVLAITLYIVPVIISLISLKFFTEALEKCDLDTEKMKGGVFIPFLSLIPAIMILVALVIHAFSDLSTKLTNKIIGE